MDNSSPLGQDTPTFRNPLDTQHRTRNLTETIMHPADGIYLSRLLRRTFADNATWEDGGWGAHLVRLVHRPRAAFCRRLAPAPHHSFAQLLTSFSM